jgi:hypothetical protein
MKSIMGLLIVIAFFYGIYIGLGNMGIDLVTLAQQAFGG